MTQMIVQSDESEKTQNQTGMPDDTTHGMVNRPDSPTHAHSLEEKPLAFEGGLTSTGAGGVPTNHDLVILPKKQIEKILKSDVLTNGSVQLQDSDFFDVINISDYRLATKQILLKARNLVNEGQSINAKTLNAV